VIALVRKEIMFCQSSTQTRLWPCGRWSVFFVVVVVVVLVVREIATR
jgi:hypothetical protein